MKITFGETCPKRNFYISFVVIVYLSVLCFEERACPEHFRMICVVPLKPAFFWTIKRRHFTTTCNHVIRSVTNINILLTDRMMWLHVVVVKCLRLMGRRHSGLKRTLVLMGQPIDQELCESRGGRPGLSILTSLLVSMDVKNYWTVLRHWSQPVPNMSTDIWGH